MTELSKGEQNFSDTASESEEETAFLSSVAGIIMTTSTAIYEMRSE
jgi:hypothetical protein